MVIPLPSTRKICNTREFLFDTRAAATPEKMNGAYAALSWPEKTGQPFSLPGLAFDLMKTREQLAGLLLDLEERLPEILTEFPPARRLGTFAYEASVISDVAAPEDWGYVRQRIHSMIDAYGMDRSYRYFTSGAAA